MEPLSQEPPRPAPRRRLAIALIVMGGIGILWGVFHVLEAANGPGTGPKTFSERRSYNQVKVAVHESFPGGAARALIGLLLAGLGLRLLDREP